MKQIYHGFAYNRQIVDEKNFFDTNNKSSKQGNFGKLESLDLQKHNFYGSFFSYRLATAYQTITTVCCLKLKQEISLQSALKKSFSENL